MDVTDVLRRLVRLRWPLAIMVLAAIAAAASGYVLSGQSRQSTVSVVVVPPKISDVAGGENPLLNLDNNLAQLATVLAGAIGSEDTAAQLARRGATADFTVSTVTGDNPSFSQLSPQLVFTVSGTGDAVVRRTADALPDVTRTALVDLQERAGVTEAQRASLVVVTPPSAPIVVSGGRLRSAGAFGVGVLVLGALVVLALDAVVRRRSPGSAATVGTPATDARDFVTITGGDGSNVNGADTHSDTHSKTDSKTDSKTGSAAKETGTTPSRKTASRKTAARKTAARKTAARRDSPPATTQRRARRG